MGGAASGCPKDPNKFCLSSTRGEKSKLMQSRRGFLILAVFLAVGLWWVFPSSHPFLVVFLLSTFVVVLLRRFAPSSDFPFLLKIFVASLILRVALAVATHHGLGGSLSLPALAPDAERYSAWGWYISTLLQGHQLQPMSPEAFWSTFQDTIPYVLHQDFVEIAGGDRFPPYSAYAVGWYPYSLGGLYYLTGYFPILPRLLNTLVGSLLVLAVYALGREIFSPKVGRLAGILCAFFPSLILWSTTGLKDPYLVLLTVLAWLGLIKWIRIWKVRWIAIFAVGIFGMWMVKPVFGAMGLLAAGGWGVAHFVHLAGKKTRVALLVLFILVAGAFVWQSSIPRDLYGRVALSAARIQFGNYWSGGQVYATLPISTSSQADYPSQPYPPGTFFVSLLRGYTYFFFAPFPGQGHSLKDLALSLHMVLGYLFLLPGVLGYFRAFRSDWRANFPIGLYLLLAATLMAAIEANFGTLIRRRDLLMPLLLIYAAGGLAFLTPLGSRLWGRKGAVARGPEAPGRQKG